jgi:flagellar basal body L-ring protein FlgH
MTARPLTTEQMQAAPNNGAIYQPAAFRPVFEDRRARHVGDVLTLVITERTSANKSGTASGNKSGSVSASVPGKLQAPSAIRSRPPPRTAIPMATTRPPAMPSPAPWASRWWKC